MALTPAEREYLQALLAREAATTSGAEDMRLILDELQTKSAKQLPSRWQDHHKDNDSTTTEKDN